MKEVVVDQSQADRRVEVSVGQTVSVGLPENASTGYRWAVDRVDASVLALERAQFTAGARPAMGTPGLRTFRFNVLAPGDTELVLKRWREWEGENSVVERFAVSVHATA